jgi:putative transcriptional regulator
MLVRSLAKGNGVVRYLYKSASKKTNRMSPLAAALLAILLASLFTTTEAAEYAAAPFVFRPITDLHERSRLAPAQTLAKGVLLVASKRLNDPGFAETVILLLEYSKDGALGVVLNRPTTVGLATVLPEIKALKKRKEVVSLGGPVGREQVLLLAYSSQPPQDSQQIFGKCYIVQPEGAAALIDTGNPALKLRAFAGYAGWVGPDRR